MRLHDEQVERELIETASLARHGRGARPMAESAERPAQRNGCPDREARTDTIELRTPKLLIAALPGGTPHG